MRWSKNELGVDGEARALDCDVVLLICNLQYELAGSGVEGIRAIIQWEMMVCCTVDCMRAAAVVWGLCAIVV